MGDNQQKHMLTLFSPTYEDIIRFTFPASNNLPNPKLSTPAVKLATVKFDGPSSWEDNSCSSVSGIPPFPNPPTATVSPDLRPESFNAVLASGHSLDTGVDL